MSQAPKISQFITAFIAGFIAVPVFHQSLLALLYAVDFSPVAPYQTIPTQPFGLPKLLSLSLWGGIWGLVWATTRWSRAKHYWIVATIFGAFAVNFSALFIFAPLKGQAIAGGWKPVVFIIGLLINGGWGLGMALLFRGFTRRRLLTR